MRTINTALLGYGNTGKVLKSVIDSAEDMTVAGVVTVNNKEGVKSFASLKELVGQVEKVDVIIDFSHPDRLEEIASVARERRIPLVLATTGYTEEQKALITQLGRELPVVYTSNYSLGIAVMQKILREITPILRRDFDMEVVESHHNRKLDAPSGTTGMLVDILNESGEYEIVYGRHGDRRRGREIGVHSLRLGTIPGENTVIYAGEDEVLTISHQAYSNVIFAKGAVKAARFVLEAGVGLYDMNDILFK